MSRTKKIRRPSDDHVGECIDTYFFFWIPLTAKMGLVRHLHTAEIVEQLILARRHFPDVWISNVVFMGMGEPLHNLDEVLPAIDILVDDRKASPGVKFADSEILGMPGDSPDVKAWGDIVLGVFLVAIAAGFALAAILSPTDPVAVSAPSFSDSHRLQSASTSTLTRCATTKSVTASAGLDERAARAFRRKARLIPL